MKYEHVKINSFKYSRRPSGRWDENVLISHNYSEAKSRMKSEGMKKASITIGLTGRLAVVWQLLDLGRLGLAVGLEPGRCAEGRVRIDHRCLGYQDRHGLLLLQQLHTELRVRLRRLLAALLLYLRLCLSSTWEIVNFFFQLV